jgi:3-isopropylmalate/(R)-2-methylmalate dehydratase large subunit
MTTAQTCYAKIYQAHLVHTAEDGQGITYIDRHILHATTSAQAFDGLRAAHRDIRRPEASFAPHADIQAPNPIIAKLQDTLDANAHDFHTARFDPADFAQGFFHPGMTIAGHADDIATTGAFGALALCTTSATVEHILATQTILMKPAPVLCVTLQGPAQHITPAGLLAQLNAAYAPATLAAHIIEFHGPALADIDVPIRIDIAKQAASCSAGALFPPDDVLFDYMRGLDFAPAGRDWAIAIEQWETFKPDADATGDIQTTLDIQTATQVA